MKLHTLCIAGLAASLIACVPTTNTRQENSTAEQEQPVMWAATLSQSCLFEAPKDGNPRTGPFGLALLAKAIDWGVGSIVDKIQEAAEADRLGYNASFQSASKFYFSEAAESKPAACLHIAQGKMRREGAKATDWCSGDSGSALCGGFAADPENDRLVATMNRAGERLKLDSPTFFAEIRLDYADAQSAMLGKATAVYYPANLKGGVVAPRDLGITASFVQPGADPATAKGVATISAVIPSLPTSKNLIVRPYGLSAIGWSTVPPKPQVVPVNVEPGTPHGAMSVKVGVTESAVENKYLQWLAKVINKDLGDKAKDKLKDVAGLSDPSPADVLALKTTALEKIAGALTARATYCTSVADKKSSDVQAAAYTAYLSAALKAVAAAKDTEYQDQANAFNNLDSSPPADTSKVCSK